MAGGPSASKSQNPPHPNLSIHSTVYLVVLLKLISNEALWENMWGLKVYDRANMLEEHHQINKKKFIFYVDHMSSRKMCIVKEL